MPAETPRERFLSAWSRWERSPGDGRSAGEMETACGECAALVHLSTTTFRDLLTVFRRAGLGREDSLDCVIPAARALVERLPNLPKSLLTTPGPGVS